MSLTNTITAALTALVMITVLDVSRELWRRHRGHNLKAADIREITQWGYEVTPKDGDPYEMWAPLDHYDGGQSWARRNYTDYINPAQLLTRKVLIVYAPAKAVPANDPDSAGGDPAEQDHAAS